MAQKQIAPTTMTIKIPINTEITCDLVGDVEFHFAFVFSPSATRRRIACARVSVLSAEAAIQASIAASSDGCHRSPTWMPLPVGGGPRLFFGTTLVFAINRGTIEASRGEAAFSALGYAQSPKPQPRQLCRGFSRRQRPDGGAEGSAAGPSRAGRIRAQQRGYRVQRSGAAFVPRLFEAGPLVYAGGLSMRTSFGLTRQTTYGVISNCALNLFCRSRGRARLARPCRVVFNNGGHHCDCQPDRA